MKTVSYTALQKFKQAVYERFSAIGKPNNQTAIDAIKQRTESFLDWQSAALGDGINNIIPDDLLRHWIAADITTFKYIGTTERHAAAMHIEKNLSIYPAYTAALQKIDSEEVMLIMQLHLEKKESLSQKKSNKKTASHNNELNSSQHPPIKTKKNLGLNGFTGENPAPKIFPPIEETPPPEQTISHILESMTHETLSDGSVLYMINQQKAFIDHGEQILMEPNKDNNEEAILAAILLAKEKYRGAFELTGTAEFKRRAIEIMVKHKIDVRLKNPQQHALRQEIAKTIPENTQDTPPSAQTVIQNGISSKIDIIEKDKQNRKTTSKNSDISPISSNNTLKVSNHLEGKVIQCGVNNYKHKKQSKPNYFVTLENANGQHSTIWGRDLERVVNEKKISVGEYVSLESKGRKAVEFSENIKNEQGQVNGTETIITHRNPSNKWDAEILNKEKPHLEKTDDHSDSLLKQSIALTDNKDYPEILDTTHPAQSVNHELRECAAAISSHPSRTAVSNINLKEIDMTATNTEQEQNVVLHGVKKMENGKFDTTVLLYKGKGDYLQGYIKIGEEERQVVAHFNQRKPNAETGESRPNYITLSEPHGFGGNTTWKEIGFGNAINKRKDSKPVYFDEVLFSIDKNVIGARLTKNVDDDMHRKLGFQEPRQKRPRFETSNAQDNTLKPVAPAANEQAVKAAGAPKKQSRRSASPMHA